MEKHIHDSAETHFKDNDHYLSYDYEQKAQLFEDTIAEFEKSVGMLTKKFGVLKTKV